MSPPLSPPASRAGWYVDPWRADSWRWWDGRDWTLHVRERTRKPRLPSWVSLPIVVFSALAVPVVGWYLWTAPLAGALALVPTTIVLAVMVWLDQVEPEPWGGLAHAFLWGAVPAVSISALLNGWVAVTWDDGVAQVISAPIVEELMKAGGILVAVRRRDVDGPMDGIIYAGWTAIGFAAIEDIQYFAKALEQGNLALVFGLRGLLAPFAHPLFTAWTGMAIGRAQARGSSVAWATAWGCALAVASHALWNASAGWVRVHGFAADVVGTVLAFVGLFFVFAVMLYGARNHQERRFEALVPWLARRYGMTSDEVALFANLPAIVRVRRRLPKHARPAFDRVHAALARLALLHDRRGVLPEEQESALVTQLQHARRGLAHAKIGLRDAAHRRV